MTRKVLCLAMFFWMLCSQSYGQQPSHEEAIVREAYAKVVYMMQLHVAGQAALASYRGAAIDRVRFGNDLEAARPIFELNSFHVGEYSEIADKKAAAIITVPDPPSKTLEILLSSQSFSENGGPQTVWPEATAKWQPAKTATKSAETIEALSNLTIQQAFALNHEGPYDRYVSFQVTITYLGHVEGPYRAFFMFGRDAQGNETVSPYDRFVGAHALARALVEPMDPAVFFKTHLRDMPVLSDWLVSTQVLDDKCVAGRACCSGSRCGIGHADLQRWLNAPLKGESAAAKEANEN